MIDLLLADLLTKTDFALETLRGEGGHVEAVVVIDGEEELEEIVVEDFGDFVADDAELLQSSHVRLKGEGLVAAADV